MKRTFVAALGRYRGWWQVLVIDRRHGRGNVYVGRGTVSEKRDMVAIEVIAVETGDS